MGWDTAGSITRLIACLLDGGALPPVYVCILLVGAAVRMVSLESQSLSLREDDGSLDWGDNEVESGTEGRTSHRNLQEIYIERAKRRQGKTKAQQRKGNHHRRRFLPLSVTLRLPSPFMTRANLSALTGFSWALARFLFLTLADS